MLDADTGCAGCRLAPIDTCRNALRRAGVVKVHWECWSECNLKCSFCFRTRDNPLTTADAKQLIEAIAAGGARILAFAGGDPTLRTDLESLVLFARDHALAVEIQTNAHSLRGTSRRALQASNRVCLSLDGSTPALHDSIRQAPGNYRKVLQLAHELGDMKIPVTVRTVVTRQNVDDIPTISNIVSTFASCERWTLLEFTPVNQGYDNRLSYELTSSEFEGLVARVRAVWGQSDQLDVFRHREKIGAYVQVTAGGRVYGTPEEMLTKSGRPTFIGNLLIDHLSHLAAALPINVRVHQARYSDDFRP